MYISLIYRKMGEYSRIPSLSGKEQVFMEYLKNDLSGLTEYEVESRHDCFAVNSKVGSKYTMLVHIDRIPVEPFQYTFGKIVKGQVDNVIGVAIMRHLFEQGVNLNALFTTREEICDNFDQLLAYTKEFPDQVLIDLDIDVSITLEEVTSGAVSVRKRDNLVPYSPVLVRYIEELCNRNKIDFINKDGHWLIVQVGMAMAKYKEMNRITDKDLTESRTYAAILVPILNYHTNKEEASEKCVRNVVKLLTKLSEVKAV